MASPFMKLDQFSLNFFYPLHACIPKEGTLLLEIVVLRSFKFHQGVVFFFKSRILNTKNDNLCDTTS